MIARWSARRARDHRDERGAVAIIVAVSMTMLLVVVAMVLDFGQVRLERQTLKSMADTASTAGIAAGDGLTGDIYSHRAVCGALSYLRGTPQFEPTATFTGVPLAGCATTALAGNLDVKCAAGSTGTGASYDQTFTRNDVTYHLTIKVPYDPTAGGWQDESMASVSSDQSTMGGCDQIGVEIQETRSPGLGSLATEQDLSFGVRSAARALIGSEDDQAPALILLERQACNAVTAGGSAKILVKGMGAVPGSIHVDSDGTGCTSGQTIYSGGQPDSIVASGSVTPTGTSGAVTAYAATKGVAATVLYNDLTRVYGTPSTSTPGVTKNGVTGRTLVGRRPVDERYRTAVRTAIAAEDTSGVWGTSYNWAANGWTVATCSPSDANAAVTTKLYINCSGGAYNTTKTLQASQVFINGYVNNPTLSMPNATRVYINNTVAATGAAANAAAINLNNTGAKFCVRITCNSTTSCPTTASSARARIFVRQGAITANGGELRMCNSTVFLLGGDKTAGCVPTVDNTAPTSTPCSGTAGSGLISVGGNTTFDWSAPNQYSGSIPLGSRATAWADFEDLAVWSESAGTYEFSGGGSMNNSGVFVVPNANPVTMGGNSAQNLTNAQYFARTFKAQGTATLTLTTDPRNAVTIPAIRGYVLVR